MQCSFLPGQCAEDHEVDAMNPFGTLLLALC